MKGKVNTPKASFDRRPVEKNPGEKPVKKVGKGPVRGSKQAPVTQKKTHKSSGKGQ